MLVLSRRLNEKIMFPDLDITFQVLSIKGGVVRIGIVAPKGCNRSIPRRNRRICRFFSLSG